MSYKYEYDPYRDTFTYIGDEQPIKIDSSTILYQTQVELSDECIQKIAERVVELIKDARMGQ